MNNTILPLAEIFETGFPAVTDLLDMIRTQSPGKSCVTLGSRVVSYGELAGRIPYIANLLDDGFVLILAGDPIETMTYWLACYYRGISCAIIAPEVYAADHLQLDAAIPYTQVLTDTAVTFDPSKKVLTLARDLTAAWGTPSVQGADGLLMLATSRSTGQLKLATHANADLAKHHQLWSENFPLVDGDIVAVPQQIPFAYGFVVAILWTLWSGKTISFASAGVGGNMIHPETTVSALPAQRLQSLPVLQNLRLAVCAGAHVYSDCWQWFAKTYPSTRLVNTVGATETLNSFLYGDSEGFMRPFSRYRARVADAGGNPIVKLPGYLELQCFVSPTYWENPTRQAEIIQNGWARLGDFAIDNGDSTFKFLGRNTITFDLENALRAEPGISDCHFTALNGKNYLLVATALSRQEVSDMTAGFSITLALDSIIVLDKLPRTISGKLPMLEVEQIVKGAQ